MNDAPKSHPSRDPRQQAWPVIKPLLIGLLVLIALTYMFSPRFALWNGLGVPGAMVHPEVNRAYWTLKQVDDPSIEVKGDVNRVLNWRTLLPRIAYHLGIGQDLYLALPALGCLVCLGYIAHLLMSQGLGWRITIPMTLILGAGNWLFVSLGWLAYFDSWVIFALLVTTFTPYPLWALAMAVLAPWIDERYVIAAPISLAVAWQLHYRKYPILPRSRGRLLWKTGLVAAAVFVYLGIRLSALISGDDPSSYSYVNYTKKLLAETGWHTMLWGLWEGPRFAWLLIIVFLYDCWRRGGNLWLTIAVTLVFIATTLISVIIATDIARTASILLPCGMAGAIILVRDYPALNKQLVPWVAVLTLLVPATHVLSHFHIPLSYLPREIERLRRPPHTVNPEAYFARGRYFYREGDLDNAIHQLNQAIQLQPDDPKYYLSRATVLMQLGQNPAAAQDYRRIMSMDHIDPEKREKARQALEQLGKTNAAVPPASE